MLCSCSAERENITADKALEICSGQVSRTGFVTTKKNFGFDPDHPITLDSVLTGKVSTAWVYGHLEWPEQVREKLATHRLWICRISAKGNMLDGINEINVDAINGEVLNVALDSDQFSG